MSKAPKYRLIRQASILIGMLLFLWCANDQAIGQTPAGDVKRDARFNSVAWMQNSAEYKLVCQQTYRFATTQMYVGLQDRMWSADEIQLAASDYEHKQPAVILDVDETVLDNSPFNARNIVDARPYSTESWNAWCREEKSTAIPGALEFVKAAEGLGVRVFYITNRGDEVKDATISNLQTLGFDADTSNVLTQNSKKNRDGRKKTRRALVAAKHRILLLIGDNLSDMCLDLDVRDTPKRNQIAMQKADMLGSRWIVLPNPSYGQWERALGDNALRLNRD